MELEKEIEAAEKKQTGIPADRLNLEQMLSALFRYWDRVAAALLAGAITGLILFLFLLPPQYVSEISIYINSRSASAEGQINMSDINASQSLVRTSIVLLKSRRVLDQVSKRLGQEEYDHDRLVRTLSCGSVEGTEILNISVKTAKPEVSEQIAGIIAEILPGELEQVLQVGAATVVDSPSEAEREVLKGLILWTAGCGLAAGIFAVGIMIAAGSMDQTIRELEEFQECYTVRILGCIPIQKKEG